MLFIKSSLTVLVAASLAIASPAPQFNPDVTNISNLVSNSILAATNSLNAVSTSAAAGGSAFAISVSNLAQTFQQAKQQLDRASHLSSDFANDPQVLEINDDFSNFLGSTISSLASISQAPTTSPQDAAILLNGALPSIAKAIDSFSSAVPSTDARSLLSSVASTLPPNTNAVVQGITRNI